MDAGDSAPTQTATEMFKDLFNQKRQMLLSKLSSVDMEVREKLIL